MTRVIGSTPHPVLVGGLRWMNCISQLDAISAILAAIHFYQVPAGGYTLQYDTGCQITVW